MDLIFGNIIGIDIGGTNIRGILLDGEKIVKNRRIKTPKNSANFKQELKKLISGLSKNAEVRGVGIGVAGVLSGTTLRFSPNISKIKNFDFKKIVPAGISLKIDNDARSFARGEYILGAACGFKSAFFLTLGTGVGRAYGKNGKILKIKKFEYPELWEQEYQRVRDTRDNIKLADFLGKHLRELLKQYNPQAVIVGGGVGIDRKNFISKLQRSFSKNDLNIKVLKSNLGDYSASFGAALNYSHFKERQQLKR